MAHLNGVARRFDELAAPGSELGSSDDGDGDGEGDGAGDGATISRAPARTEQHQGREYLGCFKLFEVVFRVSSGVFRMILGAFRELALLGSEFDSSDGGAGTGDCETTSQATARRERRMKAGVKSVHGTVWEPPNYYSSNASVYSS